MEPEQCVTCKRRPAKEGRVCHACAKRERRRRRTALQEAIDRAKDRQRKAAWGHGVPANRTAAPPSQDSALF